MCSEGTTDFKFGVMDFLAWRFSRGVVVEQAVREIIERMTEAGNVHGKPHSDVDSENVEEVANFVSVSVRDDSRGGIVSGNVASRNDSVGAFIGDGVVV